MEYESSELLIRTSSLIEDKFLLSSMEAKEEAGHLLEFIAAKSGNPSWSVIVELIEKQLGSRLKWRRPQDKQAVDQHRAESVESYNSYLNAARPSWSKKW